MTPSDPQRFRLRERLIEVLKDEHAMTLMESLPPINWDRLATKEDLAALEERTNVRFEAVDARFDALRAELGAKIDTGLAEVRGEIAELRGETKIGMARQTYVILAGLAAAMTPIYIALFTGAAG